MRVTNDPEGSVQDVMEVILTDPFLCLTVLKIVNSALYGRPKKVDSIVNNAWLLDFLFR